MTPRFKSRDAMAAYVWQLVRQRAPMDIRFRKLRGGPDVRQSVIDAAVLRLLAPQDDPVELLPKPLRKHMRQPLPAPIGNLQLHRSPLDAPRWVAFVKVYGQLFELGSFWSVTGEERDARVDQAIKKAREVYIEETRYYSPSADETIDQTQQENLSRLTEAGQERANDAVKLLENQTQESAEDNLIAAQRELRAKVEAVEDARVRAAGVEYYSKLPVEHRPVFRAICAGESVDKTIATRCGVARATVKRIRATLKGLADQFQSETPYEVEGGASAVEVPLIPDAWQTESKLITRIEDSSYEDVQLGADNGLRIAEKLHIPEIDGGDHNTLHISRRSDRVMGSRWGRGPKMYDAAELVTGVERYGGRFNDPARIAERDQYANRKFSARDMQTLEKKSAEVGFDLTGFLRAIDSFLTKRALDLLVAETIVFAPKRST